MYSVVPRSAVGEPGTSQLLHPFRALGERCGLIFRSYVPVRISDRCLARRIFICHIYSAVTANIPLLRVDSPHEVVPDI